MINYSRRIQNEFRKIKLKAHEKAIADLMAVGWKAEDAALALGLVKVALSDEYNKEQIEKLITEPEFTRYLNTKMKQIARGKGDSATEDEEQEEIPRLTKEEVLQEMLRTAMALPLKDPKRVDILNKYADLQQMKKDEVQEEDTTVHYYLPLSCNNCSLYLAQKRKIRKQQKDEEQE